ncbi:MAG: type II secretion system F family protein [Anaerolineae bacterium]
MAYRYVAFDGDGRRFEGEIEAPSETAAEENLWQQGLTVAQLTSVRRRPSLHELFPTFFGVKKRALIIFSRQLATLLTSGINILRGLRLLADQASSRALRHVLDEVILSLQRGQSFSEALAAHPLAFPPIYVSTIAVGERSGNLEEVLRRLADYLEREEALARKLTNALAYPAFVLFVAVGVVILMLTVALPPIADLVQSFNAELPWPTRALIAFSDFMSIYGVYILFTTLVLAAVSAFWMGQPSGRRVRDALFLRIPLISRVVVQGQIARFAHTASVLVRAGLPLSEVMGLVQETINNVIIREAFDRARVALLSGQGLSNPLSAESLFPPLLAQMVRVGEETGTLEENLAVLATFYEEEVDRLTQRLAATVEPALTIFVGLIVAFIALSMVMPMYSLISEIK